MLWKWIIWAILAVSLGAILQNQDSRRLLLMELNKARVFTNSMTDQYEGWQVVFVTSGITLILAHFYSFLFGDHIYTLKERFLSFFFKFLRSLPIIKTKIQGRIKEAVDEMDVASFKVKPKEKFRTTLPEKGLSHDEVLKEISLLDDLAEVEWKKGYVSGVLYYSSPELRKLTTDVFEKFVWSNPLHVEIFPQIRKMEAEVVQWVVNLFHGGPEACGVMTAGGTESIILAMRAYRKIGYEKGIKYPEIVCPHSAHCAFNKAAEYFRMKLVQVPVNFQNKMVDLRAMSRAITSNTVVLVGSAPHFPHGIIDPIQDIAKIAIKRKVCFHVDCCLGGFILPFMEKAGYKIDPFDFRLKGVTSISVDMHKYGYAPKGSSVIMYANKKLREGQFFVDPNWPGGIYATSGISGSRPGCLIATTWATLMYMGVDGYVDATRKVISTTKNIIKGLQNVPGIRVMGKPQAMLLVLDSGTFHILQLASALHKKGWHLNMVQFPPGIHFCVTMVHTKPGVVDRFLADVKECVEVIMNNPKVKYTGMAALYGMSATILDRSLVSELACKFLDLVYRATPSKFHTEKEGDL